MTLRLTSERELSDRESIALIRRAFGYVRPFKGRFAVKVLLSMLNVLPLLILPWPFKVLVDHVVRGVPIGQEAIPYPGYIEPLVYSLQGASRAESASKISTARPGGRATHQSVRTSAVCSTAPS